MPETMPEAAPVDAEAAYQDSRSVPLSEAWKLIDPAPLPQDRMEALKAHLRAAILAVIALPYPPRPGDKVALLPWELVQRALDHPTVDLFLPTDELVTGYGRRGGLHFILCRAIRSEHLASVQSAPGENEPVTLDGIARFFAGLQTLPERIDAAKDEFRADETPPATRVSLVEALIDLFLEDDSWQEADAESLSVAVADRHPRFRHHHGPVKQGRWTKETLMQRIREVSVEARELAAERRSGEP